MVLPGPERAFLGILARPTRCGVLRDEGETPPRRSPQ